MGRAAPDLLVCPDCGARLTMPSGPAPGMRTPEVVTCRGLAARPHDERAMVLYRAVLPEREAAEGVAVAARRLSDHLSGGKWRRASIGSLHKALDDALARYSDEGEDRD
jgi:hypothetical protein